MSDYYEDAYGRRVVPNADNNVNPAAAHSQHQIDPRLQAPAWNSETMNANSHTHHTHLTYPYRFPHAHSRVYRQRENQYDQVQPTQSRTTRYSNTEHHDPDAVSHPRSNAAAGRARPVAAGRPRRPESDCGSDMGRRRTRVSDEDDDAIPHPQRRRTHGPESVDHNRENTVDSNPLFVEEDSEPVNARTLKARFEAERKKSGKRRYAGGTISAPIPMADYDNATNRKIKSRLREQARARGEHIKEESDLKEAKKDTWEAAAAPNFRVKHRAGQGASDPENIELFHLYEKLRCFKKCANEMNQRRIKQGKTPRLRANMLNCRYNRTGPAIAQTLGRPFIRVSDRKHTKGQRAGHQHTVEEQQLAGWTPEMDKSLVTFEHEYDQNKWHAIAERMRAAFPDPEEPSFPDGTDCGNRFANLPGPREATHRRQRSSSRGQAIDRHSTHRHSNNEKGRDNTGDDSSEGEVEVDMGDNKGEDEDSEESEESEEVGEGAMVVYEDVDEI